MVTVGISGACRILTSRCLPQTTTGQTRIAYGEEPEVKNNQHVERITR